MPFRHRLSPAPRRLSLKAIRAGHARAARRLAALKRVCALGGVSLALLAGGAVHAQDATTRGQGNPNGALRKPGVSAETRGATPWTPGSQSLAPTFAAVATNPYGLAPVVITDIADAYAAPAFGDLDGDGDLDVLAGSNYGGFLYFQNTAGAGNTPAFAAQQLNRFGLATVPYFSTPALADADGDGDLDLYSGSNYGDITFFLNTGTPTAPAFVSQGYGNDLGSFSSLAVADFDGDGDIDILSGLSTGAFSYLQNTAGRGNAPVFVTAVANPFGLADLGTGSEYSQPSAFDGDRDGDLDLLVQSADGTWYYFQNTAGLGATPAFAARVTNPFGLTDTGASGTQPAVGDLDGDSDLDVMSSAGPATLALQYFQNTEAGATFTTQLTGAAGWRLLTAPVATATLGNLLGPVWTQGFPGADDPNGDANVVTYNETASGGLTAGYTDPTNITNLAGGGRGFFAYIYADDNQDGTVEGFPKTLSVDGPEPASPFSAFNLSFTDTADPADQDGWNLIGNPFARWIDWDAAARSFVDNTVYVYDPAISAYRTWNGTTGNLPGGIIGPFQGFWVKTFRPVPLRPEDVQAGLQSVLRVRAEVPSSGGPFYGRSADAPAIVGLQLQRADGSPQLADAFVTFGEAEAVAGFDVADGYLLTPPASDYLTLGTEVARPEDGGLVGMSIDARPTPEGTVSIPLRVASTTAGAMRLTWPQLQDVPAEWTVQLHDALTGTTVDLRTSSEYAFNLDASVVAPADPMLLPPVGPQASAPGFTGRFTLIVQAGAVTGTEPGAPAAFALSAPRPNPTAGTASLALSLPTASDVTVAVYDALGRQVAVLSEGALAAGEHALTVGAALPAGVYVVRAEVQGAAGTQTLVQRLTVVR